MYVQNNYILLKKMNMLGNNHFQLEENNLEVRFSSPVLAAANFSLEEMIPPECVPTYYNGECHANQIRKMQASFSWDWGPAFPSVGIWYILMII